MKARYPALLLALVLLGGILFLAVERNEPEPPSFIEQACGLPPSWLEAIKRGYYEPRSGQVSVLPKTPAYMASGGGGWSHSGPWPYLQDIPLVFYGPGLVPAEGEIETPVTMADVAPTFAALLGTEIPGAQGSALPEVVEGANGRRPKLIVTVVWDGGGWNALRKWPDAWPNLARLMEEGISYTEATDGSSPSVTPAVHSTLGTGVFPEVHGITGVSLRNEEGIVTDSFEHGESSRFLVAPTIGEIWDEAHDGAAKVGMVGYEPWHLGMIGKGAESPGGDHDDAVWLDVDTNEWITNDDHYRMPPAVPATTGLDEDIAALDAADGRVDGAWGDLEILDRRDRLEETPAFIHFHGRVLRNLISQEGYGADGITDLLYTNFKQIDRIAHYYNMADRTVEEEMVATDIELGRLVDFLGGAFEEGEWLVVVTADHGMQPDQKDVDGYGINPREVEADIDEHFGAEIARAVWPTEVFLLEDGLEEAGVTADDVARYLADYRLQENAADDAVRGEGAGIFEPQDRIYEMAIPANMLPDIDCGAEGSGREEDG